jgi:hypothetical protein
MAMTAANRRSTIEELMDSPSMLCVAGPRAWIVYVSTFYAEARGQNDAKIRSRDASVCRKLL